MLAAGKKGSLQEKMRAGRPTTEHSSFNGTSPAHYNCPRDIVQTIESAFRNALGRSTLEQVLYEKEFRSRASWNEAN